MKPARSESKPPRVRRSVWLVLGLVPAAWFSLFLSTVTMAADVTITLIIAQCCAVIYFALTLMLLAETISRLKWFAVLPAIPIGLLFLQNIARLI